MSIRFRQIEVFRAVMLFGSVSAAAAALRTSVPTTSRTIAELERALAFKLFHRVRRRLVPTEEAEGLFGEIQQSFVGMESIEAAAKDIAAFRGSRLRVAALTSLAVGLLPDAVSRCVATHPDLLISVESGLAERIIGGVISKQYQLGFLLLADPLPPSVQSEVLASVAAVAVLPKTHPLSNRPLIRAADFHDQPFVAVNPARPSRRGIDRAFEQQAVSRRVVAEVQSGSIACALVARGVGVAVLDPFTCRAAPNLDLVVRPFHPTIHYDYGSLVATDRPLARSTRLFLDIVREVLAELRLD